MTKESTIAFASNRGPVSFAEDNGEWQAKRGAGGLAAALDPVARRLGDSAVWVATATSEDDRKAVRAGETERLTSDLGYRVRMLDIESETYSRYYDEISNRLLWFANHCLWDEVGIEDFSGFLEAWEGAYEEVNALFASAVDDEVGPNPLVLFQDYHLSTAPHHLRAQRDDATILHFTHSSFCRPEKGLDRLPERISKGVIEGMLGADLVGLHISRWCNNFVACCEGLGASVDRSRGTVSHKGTTSWVRSYPIPIDAADLTERADVEPVRRWARRFRESVDDGQLIVRVDRSEPSKNIVRGFEAFGMLLDRRADLRSRVRFVACVYPSRQTMPEYRRYSERIQMAVDDVNRRHPDSIQLFMEDDFDRSLGAQMAYDVLLVNPIMDGMNLVSKEGVAVNRRGGALVLSKGAGSFDELEDFAVKIDDALD
ncbi:MAG TPA: trehalose-6-phosphate synthase, partial [Actinomycetota bacterium]|nr:trehalose-6-phosphate synthase [Actinomycetota bacterium]